MLKEPTNKILLIKLSSLGDVIFNIPLASVLKKNGYKVHWLVSEKGQLVVKNNPFVDKVIIAPIEKWKKSNILNNIKEFISIIRYLRDEKYDIALDTQMRLKSLLFTKFCGAKRRIISKNAKEFSIFGANEIIPKEIFEEGCHVVKNYLKYAEYLGIDTSEFQTDLPKFEPTVSEKVVKYLSNLDKNKPIVVLAPTTTWDGKHWDKDNWKELVSKISNKYNLVFTGVEKDRDYVEYIRQDFGISLVGKTNLLELIELFRMADLVISLDSGSTHLAWATSKPKILSIHCCTPKELYAPIGEKSKYLALGTKNCKPCHHKKCNAKEKLACTFSPSVEEVYDGLLDLLGN